MPQSHRPAVEAKVLGRSRLGLVGRAAFPVRPVG